MKNLTKVSVLNSLNFQALELLKKIPEFISFQFPDLIGTNFEVMEAGITTLTVCVNKKIYIKVFIPKWQDSQGEFLNIIVKNYSHISLIDFEDTCPKCLYFAEKDQILNYPVYVQEAFNGNVLIDIFYKLDLSERLKMASKISHALKKFHKIKTKPFNFNNSWRVNMFDTRFQECTNIIPINMKEKYADLRSKIDLEVFQKATTLLHNDIHLENILVNSHGKMMLIDLDWVGYGLPFLELRKIFVFCFFPMQMCKPSLVNFYHQQYPEVFEQIIKVYPKLWSKKYESEILLTLASEIMQKFKNPEMREFALIAHECIFNYVQIDIIK